MPMSPIEAERKLRQLDNDVQSIYEMLSAIQGTQARHGNRLQEHSEKLDTLETKVDALDARFDAVDSRFDGVDGRLDSMDGKLDAVLEQLRSR